MSFPPGPAVVPRLLIVIPIAVVMGFVSRVIVTRASLNQATSGLRMRVIAATVVQAAARPVGAPARANATVVSSNDRTGDAGYGVRCIRRHRRDDRNHGRRRRLQTILTLIN